MDIFRVTLLWTGFAGAPGYTNFHFAAGGGLISDATQVADRVYDALGRLQPHLPPVVSLQVQSEIEVINSDTGEITGYEEVDPYAPISGNGDPAYSAASGAVINWRTNDVRFGRRIRGRTFIVPLSNEAYDAQGTLTTSTRGDLLDFANQLTGGDIDSELGVWSRPRDGAGGVFATVVSSSVPDMAAVLRSRRD